MTMGSGIYAGDVVHSRFRPKPHRLRYRVFSLLLDLDELPRLSTKLLGYNRAAILSFHDRDHGDGTGDLRGWLDRQLAAAGIHEVGRIAVLCYPRMFGYVFNPLTVFFCYGPNDVLRAILYEVHNTFGEALTYVIPVAAPDDVVRQTAPKELYVSPFVPMAARYDFTVRPPKDRVLIRIDEHDAGGFLLRASFTGRRRPLTDRELLRALLGHPLMTLKVTAAIHWEALKLWLKGVRYIRRDPAPERVATTVVSVLGPNHAPSDRELERAGQDRH